MSNKSQSNTPTEITKKQLQDRVTELERTNGHLNFYVHELTEIVDDYKKFIHNLGDSLTKTNKMLVLDDNLSKENKNLNKEIIDILSDRVKKLHILYKHYKKESRKRGNTNTENRRIKWEPIIKHFNKQLKKRDLPNKNHLLEKGEKSRIRREANELARVENKEIKKYSDDKLGRVLKFPKST